MLKFSKLETTIVALLAATVATVALFEGYQREVVVNGCSGQWFTDVDSDVNAGGKSIAIDRSTDSQLRFEYKLDHSHDYPQAMLLISPNRDLKSTQPGDLSGQELGEHSHSQWQDVPVNEHDLLDLGWMENVHLVARIEGKEKETFRFVFRNRIDHLVDDTDAISRGFNQGLFSLTDKSREIVLSREQFQIPTWWLEKSSVDLNQHKVPVFTALEWIELSPGSMSTEKEATLVIDSIKFSGHYLPRMAFYCSVLGVWMLAAAGVLLQRSFKYGRELQMLESQVKKANVDFLTGLLNRNSVSDTIECFANYASNSDAKLSLVMFDIDNFKTLNDTYGHNHGDVVLSNIGRVISDHTQDSKLTAVRWGGEEFIVFADGYDVDEAAELAETVRASIQDDTSVTCSFGVYELSREDSMVDAIGKADKALYTSKWRGRNRVSVYGDQREEPQHQVIGVNCQDGEYIIVDNQGGVDNVQAKAGGVAAAGSCGPSLAQRSFSNLSK